MTNVPLPTPFGSPAQFYVFHVLRNYLSFFSRPARFAWLASLIFVLSFSCGYAQFKIEKSDTLDFQDEGCKILQLSNGKTFLFRDGTGRKAAQYPFQKRAVRDATLRVTTFDRGRRMISDTNVKSEHCNVSDVRDRAEVLKIFEIGGEPVVFICVSLKSGLSLIRMRLNKEDGTIVKDEQIFSHISHGSSVVISKDPRSDCYAIMLEKRLVHFNGEHTMINSADFAHPIPAYKYFAVIGCAVDGAQRVFLATYSAPSSPGVVLSVIRSEGQIHTSVLQVGDSVFRTRPMDHANELAQTTGTLKYDPSNKRVLLLTNTLAKTRTNLIHNKTNCYVSSLASLDPDSLSIKGTTVLDHKKVDELMESLFDSDKGYEGGPCEFVVHDNGTVAVLMEERTFHSDGQPGFGTAWSTYGNVGISQIDIDLREVAGHLVVKKQEFKEPYSSNRLAKREDLSEADIYGKYASYCYVNNGRNSFLLMNDIVRNIDREDNEKRSAWSVLQDFNTVCYKLENEGKKQSSYILGPYNKESEGYAMHINSANYDERTGILATLVTDNTPKESVMRMAWVHFTE